MTNQDTEPNRLVALAYVIAQAIILMLLIFVHTTTSLSIRKFALIGSILEWVGMAGVFLSAYSIRTSLTAMPLPKEHGQLATSGLYKFMRHPMYASVLSLSLGISMSSGEIYKYLLVVGLGGLFYYKSVYEEQYLIKKYEGYKAYAQKTPRFLPKIKA